MKFSYIALVLAVLLANNALGEETTKSFQYLEEERKRINFWIGKLDSTYPLVRKSAAKQLAALRANEALNPLIAHLDDKSVEVRTAIVRTLGVIGDETTISVIKKHLKRDRDRLVRKHGRQAIKNIKDRIEKAKAEQEKANAVKDSR